VNVNLNRTPKSQERGMDLAGGSKVPLSERPRATYGSLEMSVQNFKGLCEIGKCIRKNGHAGDCWPTDL
jgi:hypothetical protein